VVSHEGTGRIRPTLTPVVPTDSPDSSGSATPARTRRPVLVGALTCWAVAVAWVTLRPADEFDDQLGVVEEITQWLVGHGVPLSFELVEALANVVMFVPLGVLLTLLAATAPRGLRAPVRVVATSTLVGLVLSSGIELAQRTWLPSRYPTVQDVVMNTLGALVGALLVVALHARRERRRAGSPAGEPARGT